MANVLFKVGTSEQFKNIVTKSETTLYWLTDTQELYKGDVLFGVGREASADAAGLLSAADYQKLQDLIVTGGTINLTPVDSSIVITEAENGAKSIGVAIATKEGNTLQAVEGGLFVPAVVVPEYVIEKQTTADEGYAVSYKLKKTVGEEVSYIGDVINIPKDLVLKSATLETVTEVNNPYDGAAIGDPYIHMVFNNAEKSDIYVPVKGLVDTYTTGNGIVIDNNVISVKIADNAHGLVAVEGGLAINLATTENDGAMSKEDKAALDALVALKIAENYASKTDLQKVIDKTTAAEESYTWGEM